MAQRLIEIKPEVMMGKPVIAGTRITVELILEKLAAGETIEQIVEALRAAQDLHERRLAAAIGADQAIAVPAANFTETSGNRGLAPNCMAMPEATIAGIPETKKPAAASLDWD